MNVTDVTNMGVLNCADYLKAIWNSEDDWFINELLHWVVIEAAAYRGECIGINKSIKMSKMYLHDIKLKSSPKVYPFIDQNNKRGRK